ncbi:MAG: hypothetical protein AAFQ92_28415 [Bacteroidota bacterium]
MNAGEKVTFIAGHNDPAELRGKRFEAEVLNATKRTYGHVLDLVVKIGGQEVIRRGVNPGTACNHQGEHYVVAEPQQPEQPKARGLGLAPAITEEIQLDAAKEEIQRLQKIVEKQEMVIGKLKALIGQLERGQKVE